MPTCRHCGVQTSEAHDCASAVLDSIGEALESRGYVHMTNGRDIGRLLDELDELRAKGNAVDGASAAMPTDGTTDKRSHHHVDDDRRSEEKEVRSRHG